jgi:AI2M/AI1M-like, HNH endonuclease
MARLPSLRSCLPTPGAQAQAHLLPRFGQLVAGPRGPAYRSKLADLTRAGRPQPGWAQLMARMRRKTLVVCIPCHQAIHHGHPTALTA